MVGGVFLYTVTFRPAFSTESNLVFAAHFLPKCLWNVCTISERIFDGFLVT